MATNPDLHVELHEPIRDLMILVTLADGDVHDREIMRIRSIYRRFVGEELAEAKVRDEVQRLRRDGLTLTSWLTAFAERASMKDRRSLLKAAFAIATADGKIVGPEDEIMAGIAEGLGISPEDYRNICTHMMVGREFG